MKFKKQAEEDFNIQAAEFPEMESLINRCANIYRGAPEWLDDKNNIKTINFAKSVCSETARLAFRLMAPQGLRGCRSRLIRYISRFGTG